ncbi:hypothetical protein FAIPA1_130146 [Frankia sp. AiPs1]|uniref:hypothetical protein n=1 Tax=Frankia sp. AiPa1 TaxID=573492 RepID=UPI00202B8E73|nr:hypothetical protein [Frankia sp. AiPa1]MCL9761540.1 hypothetical protein [Frankia sp. AiPa1]
MNELRPSVEDAATAMFTTLSRRLDTMARKEIECFVVDFTRRIATSNLRDFGINLDTAKVILNATDTEAERFTNRVLVEMAASLRDIDERLRSWLTAEIALVEEFLNREAELAGTEPVSVEIKDSADDVVELADSLLWQLFLGEFRDQIVDDLKALGALAWVKQKAVQIAAARAGVGAAAVAAESAGAAGAVAAEATAAAAAAWIIALVGFLYVGHSSIKSVVRSGRKDAEMILSDASTQFKHRRLPELDNALACAREDTIGKLRTTGLARKACRG